MTTPKGVDAVPIPVADLITFVTIAFAQGSFEWAARRLARKIAPRRISLRDRIRLASICILPFLAWVLYFSFQPWRIYALAFTIVVVLPALMLYTIVRWIIVIVKVIVKRRRRLLAAARAEAPVATGGEG